MRSSHVIAAGLVIGVGAWIASGNLGGAASDPQAEPVAAAETVTLPVRVRVSEARQVERELVLLGRTQASRAVDVRAETEGRVLTVPIAKGLPLQTGDTIAQIALDTRPARRVEARALVEQRTLEYEAAVKLSEKAFRSRTALAAAEAALVSARAALAAIELDIAHTTLAAPFEGVLEDRMVEVGDFVKKGEPVASVVDLDPIKVAIDVPERDVALVETGADAVAHMLDGTGAVGTVSFVSSRANPATRTFRVEVELPNPDGAIRVGTTARVVLPLGTESAHRLSPALLTLNDAGKVGVKTVDAKGVVRFHAVSMVADTQEGMWLGGLPETARVIVVGQEYVKAGQTVNAVPIGIAENLR